MSLRALRRPAVRPTAWWRGWSAVTLADASRLVIGVVTAALPPCLWQARRLAHALDALAVASAGLIGLIGLTAPHLVRGLAGADQHRVLLMADTVARTVAVPAEIPVGNFTALIGGPAFLLLPCGVARQQGGHA